MDALSALINLIPMNDTARLLVADDRIDLMVARSDQPHRLVIETYPLGTEVEVSDLVRLLDTLGLLPALAPQAPAVPPLAPTNRRTTRSTAPDTAADDRSPCPHCGKRFSPHGLEVHIGRSHKQVDGAIVDLPQPPAAVAATAPAPDADTCDACGGLLAGHERCADCAFPIGPDHVIGPAVAYDNGDPLCRICSDSRGAVRHVSRVQGNVPLRAA
jgi:ribosomal protein L32